MAVGLVGVGHILYFKDKVSKGFSETTRYTFRRCSFYNYTLCCIAIESMLLPLYYPQVVDAVLQWWGVKGGGGYTKVQRELILLVATVVVVLVCPKLYMYLISAV